MFDLEDAKKRGCLWNGRRGKVLAEARIGGEDSIVVLYDMGDGNHSVAWPIKGDANLENLPLEREVWVAAHDKGGWASYEAEDAARAIADSWRLQGSAAGYAKVTIPLTK